VRHPPRSLRIEQAAIPGERIALKFTADEQRLIFMIGEPL